jgi:hypothetical protein
MQIRTDAWLNGGGLAVGAAPAAYMLAIAHQAMLTASFFTRWHARSRGSEECQ